MIRYTWNVFNRQPFQWGLPQYTALHHCRCPSHGERPWLLQMTSVKPGGCLATGTCIRNKQILLRATFLYTGSIKRLPTHVDVFFKLFYYLHNSRQQNKLCSLPWTCKRCGYQYSIHITLCNHQGCFLVWCSGVTQSYNVMYVHSTHKSNQLFN